MARAIWSGSINFGLVNIPIKLFTAVRDRDIRFHLLSKDGSCRLRRKLVCPETGKEFDFDKTAKGYEVAPDQYVMVDEDEIEKLRPEAGRSIEISDFVELDDIDPILFDRPYYVVPEDRGAKPYRLLLEALSRSKKVAIARFVMRSKEYLAAIRPVDNVLCIETMRFADEVVEIESLTGVPKAIDLNERELEMADRLIETLTTEFDAEKYRDEYRDRLQEFIEGKIGGDKLVVQESVEKRSHGKVIDLMEALRKSLNEARKGADEKPETKSRSNGTAKKSAGTKKSSTKKAAAKNVSAQTTAAKKKRRAA